MNTAILLRMPADPARQNSTFLKRKGGLFKKAHELSVLCSVDVAVFIFGQNKKLYEYSSCDMRELITRYTYVCNSPDAGVCAAQLVYPSTFTNPGHSTVDQMSTKDLQTSTVVSTTKTKRMRMARPSRRMECPSTSTASLGTLN